MSDSGDYAAAAPRLRPAAARACARRDGIVATEAFSRGDAIDREWMGWGALRVLSRQDWAPGAARDDGRVANMERLLLVLEGALDADCGALGRRLVEAGGALWIGSGHGTQSRLANASDDAPLRLVELWLQPDRVNAVPAMAVALPEEREVDPPRSGAEGWSVLAAPAEPVSAAAVPASAAGARLPAVSAIAASGGQVLPVRQQLAVMIARLGPGDCLGIPAAGADRCWLEVLAGDVAVADADAMEHGTVGTPLASGDGLAWIAGAAGAPVSVAASGEATARLLLLALPA